jgi:hypothetical protein
METKVWPLWLASLELEKLSQHVDDLAAATVVPQCRDVMRPALEISSTELAQKFEQFVLRARQANIPDDPGPIAQRISARIEGIHKFVTGEDDGVALRAAAADRGGNVTELINLGELLKIGGRPGGLTPWRTWLGQRARELCDLHPQSDMVSIARRIKNELAEKQQRGMLDDLEKIVWERMTNKSPHKLKRLVQSAKTAYEKAIGE